MKNICIINKKIVAQSRKLKQAQRKTRKHYQEKLFENTKNAPKAKIRKIADLDEILFTEYRISNNKTENYTSLNI